MKICPKCQKTYTDDNLNFCLEDGTVLQQMASAAPPPTVAMNVPITQQPVPPQTFQQADSPQGGWQQPQQAYSMQPPKKSSKAWIWVLLILGLILLACGGGAAGLFYIGYQEQQNQLANSNSSTPTWASPTPRKNSTTTPTTTSPSSRTNVDSLDLSLWVRPASVYGSTKFEGGELIVSSKDADHYYVITGAEDLKSSNADVSITVRNVNSKAARTGYGLIFHSDPDRALRQDYVLLIDSMKQRYRIARHDSSQELDVTDWTKNTAINSGSAENKLEIRDHPDTGKVDLYINGQLVDSIKNEFGYPGGVVGIYAGDAIPVAFKDFEIRTN
ncbi:MAG: hypothetical protein R2682_12070 [Pyrinomonadaceae bacterium]